MSIDELWLKPYGDIGPLATYRPEAFCAQCAQVSHVDTFVTEHLLETLSRPPVRSVRTSPRYAIESPMGKANSYSGVLGFYSPPADDEPGRFWTDMYFWMDMYFSDHAQPYYETTTGFDAAVANALGLPQDDGTVFGASVFAWRAAIVAAGMAAGLIVLSFAVLASRRRRLA